MSLIFDREFLTQSAVCLGLCLGAWTFFVKPKAEELHDLETQIVDRKAIMSASNQAVMERVIGFSPELRRRADEIEARGRLSRDPSQPYGRIQKLAEEHSVAINNLRPGQDSSKGAKDRQFVATRVDVTVDGSFQNIAEFLQGLDGLGGYLRPVAVQVAPAKGPTPEFTTMQLGFEVLAFKLPEAFARKEESPK